MVEGAGAMGAAVYPAAFVLGAVFPDLGANAVLDVDGGTFVGLLSKLTCVDDTIGEHLVLGCGQFGGVDLDF